MLFKKKCTLCGTKIPKGKEHVAKVKIPEYLGLQERPFCSKKHAKAYEKEVLGTPRTSYCPSCGV